MLGERMKYLVVSLNGHATPILFPPTVNHIDIADRFANRVFTGGFVTVQTGKDGEPLVQTYGESISCKVKSDPADAELITRYLVPK